MTPSSPKARAGSGSATNYGRVPCVFGQHGTGELHLIAGVIDLAVVDAGRADGAVRRAAQNSSVMVRCVRPLARARSRVAGGIADE